MKLLLFGGNGQVGTELRRSLAGFGEVVVTTRNGKLAEDISCEAADFNSPETLAPLIERVAPDVVVNAAAYTAVDAAEDDVAAAFRANAEAPHIIAEACSRRGALLVHYSTDYVFDGRGSRPYGEDDPVSPIGVYGASKLAGEMAIRDSGARHLIFRTAWVYATHGRNFLRTMLRLASERDELRVVADQVGSPTPAALIADVTAQVLGQSPKHSGLWHLTSGGQTSWHGFAEAIMTQAFDRRLLPRKPHIAPINTADYPTRAARPAYSVLDCRRFEAEFGIALPCWHDALRDVLNGLSPTL
jgi:dTDP-4-dehydrorhamnose reductase